MHLWFGKCRILGCPSEFDCFLRRPENTCLKPPCKHTPDCVTTTGKISAITNLFENCYICTACVWIFIEWFRKFHLKVNRISCLRFIILKLLSINLNIQDESLRNAILYKIIYPWFYPWSAVQGWKNAWRKIYYI